MQALLASLVVGMSVKDTAFRSAMAANRADVKRTGQDFDRSADQMGGAIERAAKQVNAAATAIVDSLAGIGREVQAAGLKLTLGLSLPMGLLAGASKDAASDFEVAMNKVQAAMVTADPAEIEKLRDAALTLGPAFGKSAGEAAGAIEALAKSGMDASAILGGGLESAMKLSVVGQADLTAAAEATTDIVQQFHLSAEQLPGVVDKVTGALDASKLGFDDYRLAIGQVGGVAGGLGYTFDDMNTALAATASYFQSGSDAGTSFKTLLTTLNPQSKDAERVMTKLGIITKETGNAFFQANGQAKSLADIAEVLRSKLGNLSDRSMQDALTTMFGTDAMRSAIALMKEGAAGINDVQAAIDKVSAGQKMAVLLDGEAAATQRLASSWEKLKIAIGEAGILQAMTWIKESVASAVGYIASMPPAFFKVVVAAGALVAAAGPLVLILAGLAKVALPLLAMRLGPVALGLSLLVNPLGLAIRLLAQFAVQVGGATIISRLGTAILATMGPLSLLTGAMTLAYMRMNSAREMSTAYATAQTAMGRAHDAATRATDRLANSTGRARDEALALVQALRAQQVQAVATARSMLKLAVAEYTKQRTAEQSGFAGSTFGTMLTMVTGRSRTGAARDLVAANATLQEGLATLRQLDGALAAPAAGGQPKVDMSFDDADKKKGRTKTGRDAERDEAQYRDALGSMRVDQLRANAELTESAHARYDAEMASIAEERASFIRRNAADDGLTAAKRATLLAAKDEELAVRKQIAERQRFITLTEQDADMARTRNEAEQELARATIDLADSSAGRRAGEHRLLAIQRQQEEADLELVLATKASATAEYQRALDRKGQLDKIYGARSEAIDRNNEGAGERYLRELGKSSDAMREDFEAVRVDALKGLNSDLTDAIMGTRKLGDAFQNMGKRIMASLIDIAIQQKVIRPLAEGLFGAGSAGGSPSGGGGLFASIASGIGGLFKGSAPAPGYGGGRATGGPVAANRWYTVGERGPERFFPGISGTVIPNDGRGADRGMGGFTYAPVINAQGAGPREIDALRAELRQQQRELPGTILATMSDAASRGMTRR